MKVLLLQVSDSDFREEREVDTMEDLKNIYHEYSNHSLIVDFMDYDYDKDCECITITIYDDYIE
jgi:hypothetical protein